MRLRIARILLGSGILLSAIGFAFCYMLASPTPPYSSMGNVAIFFVGLLVPITAAIVYGWLKILGSTFLSKWGTWLLVLLPIHIVGAIMWQVHLLDGYRKRLGDDLEDFFGYRDDQYILDITQGFADQLNNQFFNVNTWLAYISLTLWMALVIISLTRRKTTHEVT